jgi:chemotaxis signal transduction protein
MELFRRKIVTKYAISNDVISFIVDIRKTLDEHKKSSVEFTKKETFVISDNNYNLTTLKVEDVKKTLTKAKHHIEELFKIIKYQ